MNPPDSILIIQLRRVGDVVFTLPTIGLLRRNFPDAKIDFLVEEPSDQLVRLNPHLNEVLVYNKKRPLRWISEIRKRRYDWVLDYHSNGRTLMITFFSGAGLKAGFEGPWTRRLVYDLLAKPDRGRYIVEEKIGLLKALDLDVNGWKWEMTLPQHELDWADAYLKQNASIKNENGGGRINNLIGIAPATRRETRAWIPQRFAEVMKTLSKEGKHCLFLWGPGERTAVDSILSSGVETSIVPPETTLLELSALISRCSLVLAVDNGPKNIAVALEVPTLTIAGPTNQTSFNPPGDPSHAVIRDDKLFCIACGLNLCPYHHECMQNISAKAVIEKIGSMLERQPNEKLGAMKC